MASDPMLISRDDPADSVEMPRPTAAPLILALGMALMAGGVATNATFLVVGLVTLVFGLGLWVVQLLPDRGEYAEPLVEPAYRPGPVEVRRGSVGRMQEGMPGSRLQLPSRFHPISAGIKGGIVGGLLMPIPALIWGLTSGHGIWYPVNLLAGLAMPGVDRMTVPELEQFRPALLILGLVMHAINSVTFGLIYGVLMPMLPNLPRPLAWGGLAMPMLWTALTFGPMSLINPALNRGVSWPWFIASQFVFGVVAAAAIALVGPIGRLKAGLVGGVAGGLLMPIPALLWGIGSGHGVWYPANLLAGVVLPHIDRTGLDGMEAFHPGWLAVAVAIHAAMSLAFGALFGVLVPRLRPIPSTLAWGGLLMPLLWTSVSYGLMGVVNPLLQERVDWAWFIASQFVFGVVAATVVHRSERVGVPPAGDGTESPGRDAAGAVGGEL